MSETSERRKLITASFASTCRVCGGAVAKGDDALIHSWESEYAHPDCGWVTPAERALLAKVAAGRPIEIADLSVCRRLHGWGYVIAPTAGAPAITPKGRRELALVPRPPMQRDNPKDEVGSFERGTR